MAEEKSPQIVQLSNEYCKVEITNISTKRYDVYLNYMIDKPHHYVEFLELLRSADENDEIYIHINNNGGYLDTAIQLINTMKESKAHIITCLEGACHSAASLVFLSGDSVRVAELGSMLCHYYSGGSIGKGQEIESQVMFDKDYYKKLFHKIYSKFLTPQEIKKVIDGQDIWLDSQEVLKRAKSMKNNK